MKWLVPFVFLMVFETIGNFLTGLVYSIHNLIFFSFILLLFAIANYFWLISLKGRSGLARGSVYFGVGIVLTTAATGIIFYNETFDLLKISGIVLGLVSIVLMTKD